MGRALRLAALSAVTNWAGRSVLLHQADRSQVDAVLAVLQTEAAPAGHRRD